MLDKSTVYWLVGWLVMAIYIVPILGYTYSKVLNISQLIVSHMILERLVSSCHLKKEMSSVSFKADGREFIYMVHIW